ncbi:MULTISPECIES: branched-chain amino acid transport system II carrier protein [Bizionia]|uniref:Branched-chain amino acid transport system II carrier protein n=1 Tax=Bizionia algoritergicola TaxID=291187 RepID=A0A5D0R051_9FLAO|nr:MULTISPECIES: branched-chain amino acid transport system II carrier protein [Bizionia]OBX23591.1 branched-chain amino acid transport system II carrier protein [Bizionia sp. APA-3]TYB74877.1 branched-chain amino acid transport system II carrier protein [Bizionia algoritergicola]
MNKTKQTLIVAFALFSLFFGAGNLILPPYLGVQAGGNWYLVAFGFALTAVIIPILGIYAHARLQGTMFDFGKKVSPIFSAVYCVFMYAIAVALPAPRTASVTHEMAIAPFFDSPALLTSCIYFAFVFLFVMNRSRLLSLIGKYLTPLIVIILLIIIGLGIYGGSSETVTTAVSSPFALITSGIFEGYQTFDAIAGVVVGAVIVLSLKTYGEGTFEEKKKLISQAGFIAGFGLFIIYAGLIICGYLLQASFPENATRTEVLTNLSQITLGNIGTTFLSVLVALACFTTAVGIITGASDYVSGLFQDSRKAYTITAILSSVIGVIVGSYNVAFIIDIALPALMFIYPITIVLILLNVLPQKFASETVFKAVVLVTFIFSIPDFLKFLIPVDNLQGVLNSIPLANHSLGWVLPALIVFLLLNFKNFTTKRLAN